MLPLSREQVVEQDKEKEPKLQQHDGDDDTPLYLWILYCDLGKLHFYAIADSEADARECAKLNISYEDGSIPEWKIVDVREIKYLPYMVCSITNAKYCSPTAGDAVN